MCVRGRARARARVCVIADMEVVWNEVCVTCCQYHLRFYLGEMKVTEIPVGRESKPGL